ncbi:hypothetical protein HER10_EVM0004449 [Colletotrichum scovillei]|uniref:Uncharacterized protein n=2 Tax=Colletotrichum acutatum species complex TaxID=2707335 RepID=A0A9P7UDS4_9PEZI|nr:uncharacterized protein HER10_EVM0004449 [Colletotrichum scovillei]KXH56305.1 hypothetical protein CNYM01_00185 [Colletotrichum nymphaeae SA-01]KAF4784124.1 hypothetical protein HER10_EVM0004449 [Colletotrichum scovillei]KAG7044382.1 hypothetical protein JMJ77_0003844 [Colletotrichum scovillei]KAG7049092.1 hypothetical protein JMJ78_0013075 [Colletotrichum scovillei]KAG7063834.1 hypothetical protein JMJ76_0006882 [Colletotrichum scovillei]
MDDTNIRSWASRLKSYIPGFSNRQKMAETNAFAATDKIVNRYADTKVLQKTLLGFGFPKDTIKIKATKAGLLEVQLPRKLTPEEMEKIHADLKKAAKDSDSEEE